MYAAIMQDLMFLNWLLKINKTKIPSAWNMAEGIFALYRIIKLSSKE